MEYDGYTVLEAWKKAVNYGVIDTDKIRPETAQSWARCLNYGLDPWSSGFPKSDGQMLERMRNKYKDIMEAASPVLQYLLALFNCNVSIADMHGFVFDLVTPLSSYPRTLGTFVTEALNGTGNLPLAIIEKKPIRVEGYEHFRAVSQNYSGVATIVHTSESENFVLCLNEPFVTLPKNALNICIAAGKLIEQLSTSRRLAFSHLSAATFFDPILALDQILVVVTDQDGAILTANAPAKAVIDDYDNYPYGSRSLGNYLKNKQSLNTLLHEDFQDRAPFKFTFRKNGIALQLLRRRKITMMNGIPHYILVFDNPDVLDGKEEKPAVKRSVDRSVDYIGQSDAWQKVDSLVQSVASHKSNVMIMGDTGTGKEVVARALHRLSGRKGEFVAINCGALPRELLASELFGYEGGAFTGARSSGAKGKFEYANGGTLFLDEIGDMPLDMQVSLLRVIQEQCVTRIGANKPIPFDVRVIAATNQNMNSLIAEKKFRSDLWYRISVIEIRLPALQERIGDISLLAQHFNETLSESLNVSMHPLSAEVLCFLEGYSWPGNVRELKNIMEKALIIANGRELNIDCFPDYIKIQSANAPTTGSFHQISAVSSWAVPPLFPDQAYKAAPSPREMKDRIEAEKIIALLEEERGNISRAAKRMGISRNTLYRRIKKLDIQITVRAHSES